MKTNVALIGYMASGKTSVGKMLAERLGKNFIELDWVIEEQAEKTIPDIFKDSGEIAFRELEIQAAKVVAGEVHSVIACGGGLVLNKINIDRLRENGVTVCLTASPEVTLKRVSGEQGQRPLLEVEDQLKTIIDMQEYRRPFYERAADITIDTSELDIGEVVDEIIRKLKEIEEYK
jgi:shikimate kinase